MYFLLFSVLAPITGSDDDNSAQVAVPIVISLVLVLLGGGVGIYVLWRWYVSPFLSSLCSYMASYACMHVSYWCIKID